MIHHGDTETRSKLLHEELTEKVIGAAIEVHRVLVRACSNPLTRSVCVANLTCGILLFSARYRCRSSIKASSWTAVIASTWLFRML